MTPKSKNRPPRRFLFPGSFNPFTKGHYDIAKRALALCDQLIIGVGVNIDKEQSSETKERVTAIHAIFATEPRVLVAEYSGLTAQLARELGISAIVRGVRDCADFEKERNLADANRELFGIETILLPSQPRLSWLSSSAVRELDRFGYDTSNLLPKSEL